MGLGEKIFGTYSDRQLKKLVKVVDYIEELAPKYAQMSNEELSDTTRILKERLAAVSLSDPECSAKRAFYVGCKDSLEAAIRFQKKYCDRAREMLDEATDPERRRAQAG